MYNGIGFSGETNMYEYIAKAGIVATWLLLAAILMSPVGYVLWSWPQPGFWDNVMSGLLATGVALVSGIPSAFWIDRKIKERDERKVAQSERKRELELLDLLKEELIFTNDLLQSRIQRPTDFALQPLKSALWEAVSGGKVNLTQNHRLLNRMASAYYVINLVRRIEEQAYHSLRVFAMRSFDGKGAWEMVWRDARMFDVLLSESIREALREIEEEQKKVG